MALKLDNEMLLKLGNDTVLRLDGEIMLKLDNEMLLMFDNDMELRSDNEIMLKLDSEMASSCMISWSMLDNGIGLFQRCTRCKNNSFPDTEVMKIFECFRTHKSHLFFSSIFISGWKLFIMINTQLLLILQIYINTLKEV